VITRYIKGAASHRLPSQAQLLCSRPTSERRSQFAVYPPKVRQRLGADGLSQGHPHPRAEMLFVR
jgi:hypothetical protein